jgi:hypothetical protein
MVVSKSLASLRLRVEPGEAPLHHPAARVYGETDLIGGFADDLDGDAGGIGHALGSLGGVRKGKLDEGKAAAGRLQ